MAEEKIMVRLSKEERRRLVRWQWAPYMRSLQELAVPFSFKEGNCALIMELDHCAPVAARVVQRFYPPAVCDALYAKHTMPSYLGGFGFNELPTRLVRSVADIGDEINFCLKPVFNQGGIYSGFKGVAYKKFSNVADLLNRFPDEARINRQIAGGFVLQRAVMTAETQEVVLRGTVNSVGEVYWCRNSMLLRRNGKIITTRREWGGFDADRQRLQSFISSVGIRNAAFMLVQLRVNNGDLYPIDWNFRLGTAYTKHVHEVDYREIKRALAHQFDVSTPLPDTFPGNWRSDGDWIDGYQPVVIT